MFVQGITSIRTASLPSDPDTGKLKWYFQFTPHDLYDYDATETPVLVDAVYQGQPRKLIIEANRNGFIYILDRTNGKFLAAQQFSLLQNSAKGIDADGRPIPTGNVPTAAGTRVCPGVAGATNWFSPAYSEVTHLFYFMTLEDCNVYSTRTEEFEEGKAYYSTGTKDLPDENARKMYCLRFRQRKIRLAQFAGWKRALLRRCHDDR